MAPRMLVVAIVAGLAATGCGNKDEKALAGKCTTAECQVKIDVVGGVPKPDRDPLPIAATNQGAGGNGVIIVWHIQDPDYSFRDDGIQPKEESAAGWPSQFDQPGTGGAGKQFHWRDKNGDTNKYKYKITIYDRNGNPHTLDPAIQNGAQ